MSLYEEADGILDTHVQWNDIQEEMQKKLKTNAVFGEGKQAINISDMKGFSSRIALIHPDWCGSDDVDRLPKMFCVKMSSQLQMKMVSKIMETGQEFDNDKNDKLSYAIREVHNREVDAYNLLMKFNHANIPLTKIYATKKFENEQDLKGYIITSYVEGIVSIGMHQSIPIDNIYTIVRAIGTLAGLGQQMTDEQLAFCSGPDFTQRAFNEFFDEKARESMNNSIRKEFPIEFKDKIDKLIDINEHYSSDRIIRRYTNIKEYGFALVLNHGDLWSANMLFTKNDSDNYELNAIIDWQLTTRNSPGYDLSRLLIGSLTTNDRRIHKKNILELYYNTFKQIHGANPPFSLQELFDSYHLFLPIMSMFVISGVISFKQYADVQGKEREEMESQCMDKLQGIVEDVLEAHEYNLQHHPNIVFI